MIQSIGKINKGKKRGIMIIFLLVVLFAVLLISFSGGAKH